MLSSLFPWVVLTLMESNPQDRGRLKLRSSGESRRVDLLPVAIEKPWPPLAERAGIPFYASALCLSSAECPCVTGWLGFVAPRRWVRQGCRREVWERAFGHR